MAVAITLGQIPDDEAWHRTIILPFDILDNPPSGEHEVDWEAECAHRIWGCELLQEAGILLRCVTHDIPRLGYFQEQKGSALLEN